MKESVCLAKNVNIVENKCLFTLKQAAEYTICTPRYLQNQIRLGRLKALKPTGKLLRIRPSDLEKFLESGATIEDEK